jgi:hypothetical protein
MMSISYRLGLGSVRSKGRIIFRSFSLHNERGFTNDKTQPQRLLNFPRKAAVISVTSYQQRIRVLKRILRNTIMQGVTKRNRTSDCIGWQFEKFKTYSTASAV